MMRPLVVGNWKMHGTQASSHELASSIARGLRRRTEKVDVVLAPPFTALTRVERALRRGNVGLAGQNCHWQGNGAFTGEVSAPMLRDAGCAYVILGHSERRRLFQETDQRIADKIKAALQAQLRPILCVGETLGERRRGLTMNVITRQLRVALKGLGKSDIKNVEVAYEPVWAIGTGHNASPEQVGQVHERIRRFLVKTFGNQAEPLRILYGGSVKADNAAELAAVANVNGFLVGGASLQAEGFIAIVDCFSKK